MPFARLLPLFLATALALGPAAAPSASAAIVAQGTFPNLEPGAAIALKRIDLESRNDTREATATLDTNHGFRVESTGEPGLFALELPENKRVTLALASDQTATLSPDPEAPEGIAVAGSPDTEQLRRYEAFRKESLARLVYPPRQALRAANESGASDERIATLSQAETDGYDAHRRELNDFVIDGMQPPTLALYATSARWDRDYRIEELAQRVDALARAYPDLEVTRRLQAKMDRFAQTAIGATPPNLEGSDLDGATRSLESVRGKVTLVDFWASWCLPCRIENRHYAELRAQLGDQGFEIFSVNLDTDEKRWRGATQRDGVTWPQIGSLQGWNDPAARAYDVSALPASFLLDADGRIVGRDLRGAALEEAIKTLLDKK